MKRTALILAIVSWSLSARADVELKIITADGFVAFTVKDHWPVISMATEPPIMTAVFQLPNVADQGTPDSTNLSIRFFDLGAAAARERFRSVGEPIGSVLPERDAFEGWTVYQQQAKQGDTEYSIIDAKRDLDTLSVAVRIAWPHLKGNPRGYSDEMQQTFRSVLRSIYQHIGPYEPGENEVIRRRSP